MQGDNYNSSSIHPLILNIQKHVIAKMPDQLELFKTFANEAIFARNWLDSSLKKIDKDAVILEVGAGLLLVSGQLTSEGYKVYALEPIGDGFTSFAILQKLIYDYLSQHNIAPEIVASRIEDSEFYDKFDFAFSVNVMEHIDDVGIGLSRIIEALKSRATYKFVCPNYHFPYEPHFGIPTLFSKRLTEYFFENRIFNNKNAAEPDELWKSLNWITVSKVKSYGKKLELSSLTFATDILSKSIERLSLDAAFANRHPKWIVWFAKRLSATKLHKLLDFLPPCTLPIMDCSLTKL